MQLLRTLALVGAVSMAFVIVLLLLSFVVSFAWTLWYHWKD